MLSAHSAEMLSSEELLRLMAERGVKQVEIAKALGVAPPRVSEMYRGERQIKLDEAKTLVETFGLSSAPAVPAPAPLSEPVARLLVLHGAAELGIHLDPADPRVTELAKDFQAFSRFSADHRVKLTEDSVQAFFLGLLQARDRSA